MVKLLKELSDTYWKSMDNKKRILIVSAHFYPQNSPRANRATELAKEFARQGHEVKVLTVFDKEDYKNIASEFGISIANLGNLKWKSPVFGDSKVGFIITRALYRLLSLSFEFPDIELAFLVKNALKLEKKYDLMISIAVPYPVHWGVAACRQSDHQIAKVWVADCGDPYMGCQTDSFRKFFYFKYIEKWFMRKADYISIPIESAKAGYYSEFHHKIKIIPQGFRIEPINGANRPFENSVPTFAYAGGFIPKIRDPRPFLDHILKIEKNFKFIIFTKTPELIDPYKSLLNGKMEVRNYLPRIQLLEYLVKMDFLINFDNNTGIQLPSKLIDYALVNRPILNIKAPLNVAMIDEFFKGDYSNKLDIPNIDQYNIENVACQFANLL